jgi:uncharacterized protein YejL (UPF0352 family)
VINAQIILWMLEILCKYKQDQDLSLLAAKTILKVVDSHQIIFDYQEMAIIKKFNKALDNIESKGESDEDTVSPSETEELDEEDSESQ